jgi:hypothetical protein
MDGSFTVGVPAEADMVRLYVLPPGHIFCHTTVHRESYEATGSVDLRVPSVSGTITLNTIYGLLMVNGEPVPTMVAGRWAGLNGERAFAGETYKIPRMPVGSYALCDTTWEETLLVLAGLAMPESDRCSEGVLDADGELTLT